MKNPLYSDLHVLKKLTAWVSEADLSLFSKVNSIDELYKLSPKTKQVAESKEFFLVYETKSATWSTYETPKEGMSFWQALELSKEWKRSGFSNQIVPKIAWEIIDSLENPRCESISFKDGSMVIKGVNLSMPCWFSF